MTEEGWHDYAVEKGLRAPDAVDDVPTDDPAILEWMRKRRRERHDG